MWLYLLFLSFPLVFGAPEDVTSGVWLSGPKGHYYLIGKGKESWINAREYCLARNADLMSLDSPTSYIGLFRSFFPEWRWISSEMFQENIDVVKGDDQCGVLSLKNGSYFSVDCDDQPEEITRFICERTAEAHEEQHKTENSLWTKVEALLEYLGLKKAKTTETLTTVGPINLEDPGELAKDIEHAERLLNEEGSGNEDGRPASVAVADRLLPLVEKTAEEGSGAEIELGLTEGSGEDEQKTSEEKKRAVKATDIEHDFSVDDTNVSIEDVPIPPKKDDCFENSKVSEESAELLGMLRQFLGRATHSDLRRFVDDDSHTLKDRLLQGISEANAREFEAVLPADELLDDSEKELLFDELSRLLVPEEKARSEALKMREEFV